MMATYTDGIDNPFVNKSNLAITVYEKKQFPFAFQCLSEVRIPSRKDVTKMDGDEDEGLTVLVSDEEYRRRMKPISAAEYSKEFVTPALAEGWIKKTNQGPRKRQMQNGSSENLDAEISNPSRKRLFVTKKHQDAEERGPRGKNEMFRPAENIGGNSLPQRFEKSTAGNEALSVGLSKNRSLLAASTRDMNKCKRNRDCAGVIPLADAEVFHWMAVNRKEELEDLRSDKLRNEKSTRRTVAVKISQSSAIAKKSVFPLLCRAEAKETSQPDLASRGISQYKPRGVLKITGVIRPHYSSHAVISNESPAVNTKETINRAVSEKLTEKAREKATGRGGFSQKQEEIRSLLRADVHPQRHEESEERKLVRQTLEDFEVLRRKVLREEEVRVRESRNAVKRPDLKAGSIMKSNDQWLNVAKTLGALPGIEVGDQFYFRIELCIIGLHRQIQAGIDSIHPKDNQWDVPLAASIIASGGYEDDLDDGETLIYTGQGGNNYYGDKRQQQDQKLERGNLALKHSYKIGVAVRVIRGSKCKDSPSGKIYTYDGLYRVEKFWLDKGLSGYGIYKFQLQRLSGQSQTSSANVRFMGTLKGKSSAKEMIVMNKDISRGKESLKVFVVNSMDSSPELPAAFEYITDVRLPCELGKRPALEGCGCIGGCSNPRICCCVRKNGGEVPYTGDGTLINVREVLYECGPQCQCPPTCLNRVSQNGTKYRLEVFKKERGWGLRSWDCIPHGGFVCEYIGQVVASPNAWNRFEQRDYVLHVDRLKKRGVEAVDDYISCADLAQAQDLVGGGVEPNFVIDAREYGNVARFINHSDSPNLYVQFVLYDHGNLELPHVMLFATENLRPFTELTFDHGKDVTQISASDET